MRPFSKHSMAKAMQAPAEMVSTPWRLQMSLAKMSESRLSLQRLLPNMAMVSYSGLWAPSSYTYSPVPAFMMPPQAMGQRQQP